MLTKKIRTATVAVAIGIACLFPAIAQAQSLAQARRFFQFSGLSDLASEVYLNFSLDTSVADINSLESVGEFPGAIQNFTDSGNPNTNLSPLSFPSGNVTTSRLAIDPITGEVLPIIKDDQKNLNINFSDLSPGGTFNNDWLRFDVTFPDTTETLTLFIPSNDSSGINSLSDLNDILASGQVQAVVSRPDIGRVEKLVASNPDPSRRALTFVTVPETTPTTSLFDL
ncbi:MAG: hypothetical protein DSM106950_42460 [Stigonema ocellatum SAG 48.90 = DSM 106950]|nr:hypothetical protein [Stigonema ocellatum SAG 48.90 = DSM 106950]